MGKVGGFHSVTLGLLAAACGSDLAKPPFDTSAIDQELGSAGYRADALTNATEVKGMATVCVPLTGQSFLADKLAGYELAGNAGDQLDIDLTSPDADPVLLLYGPKAADGSWPERLAKSDDFDGLQAGLRAFALPATGTYLLIAAEFDRAPGTFDLAVRYAPPAEGATGPSCDPPAAPGPTCVEAAATFPDGKHNPGAKCTMCHKASGPGPAWTVSGTLYTDAAGTAPLAGATVRITDAAGQLIDLVSAANGNFYSAAAVTFPLSIWASRCPDSAAMTGTLADSQSCNTCHTSGNRIHLP